MLRMPILMHIYTGRGLLGVLADAADVHFDVYLHRYTYKFLTFKKNVHFVYAGSEVTVSIEPLGMHFDAYLQGGAACGPAADVRFDAYLRRSRPLRRSG